MKTLALIIALGGCLLGQTRTTTSQLAPSEAAVPSGLVYVLAPDGTIRAATLDATLTMTCTAGGCVLGAVIPVAPSMPVRRLETVKVATLELLTITTTNAITAELDVVRNGIEQTQGEDYDVAGQVITFRVGSRPRNGDIVRVKYR